MDIADFVASFEATTLKVI